MKMPSRKSRQDDFWAPGERRRSRWPLRLVVVGGFIVFFLGVAYVVDRGVDWYTARSATTTTTEAVASKTTEVVIDSGMTTSAIGRLLEEEGVIDSSSAFVDLVKARGSENRLRPGNYEFEEGLQLVDVVDMLEQGKGAPSLKLTIPEGRAIDQIADLLNEEGSIDGDTYVSLTEKPNKFDVPEVGGTNPKLTTLEGLLFPSTYYLYEGDGASELIEAQLVAFASKTDSLPWEKAEALGLTPYQIVIVASLIEKEARIADERAKIAAVIYNRIEADMTLGIDATVRYAVGKWTEDLTTADLQTDSPYNTRVVKGLPPTPIANPGVATLKAALEPVDVDYLYYVLSDTDGHHFFTASYEEFLEAKEKAPDQ
ncbi:MAG: endolytic transglycosylase MltG [Thermoleophilia bacterium]|nr:endolytic transglycosylase MltG [Thermoleophilia bacterium]